MGELNQHNLRYYIDKYNTKVFVETGTGRGTGTSYALTFPFEVLFSIEINKDLCADNAKRFNDSRLILLQNNSLDGLQEILTKIADNDTPILFWLDAHFPGADFKLGSYDDEHPRKIKYPLVDELQLICSIRKKMLDIFIIDDLQLYEDGNYELKASEDFLKKHKQYIDFNTLFNETHDIKRDYRHQGFLILTPKVG